MFIVCYLAHDTQHIAAVQERLALSKPPKALVTARSAPELIHQVQTLPVQAALVDMSWPRATWAHLATTLQQAHPELPIFALASEGTDQEWWQFADDLLRLDETYELFMHRLERMQGSKRTSQAAEEAAPAMHPSFAVKNGAGTLPSLGESPSLLENTQFRKFAEIFSGMEESTLLEAFVAWAQQACQTSRVVLLVRDPQTGDFTCRAHRGLSSTLVQHCIFSQTAPLCHWLTMTGRILLRDDMAVRPSPEVFTGLDLMQAVAAVPIVFDGQLVAILGLGPRLVGHGYSACELEALFALGGQIASAMHHCRIHRTLRVQQEMTEHMLSVMPTGALVIGGDNRIAFVNTTAASLLGKTPTALLDMDLRVLPSPLGDMAYQVLLRQQDIPRRELNIITTGRPVAVAGFALQTTPPSAMLLVEDLLAHRQLEEERERRVNLEVVTNLVHYLAHELRNPLVALSTYSNLAPTKAGDPEFQEFCQTVLQGEIGRVNLILEQLLVLTNHVEFQFGMVNLSALLERVTGMEEIRASLVLTTPMTLPSLYGDAHRLETALMCIVRTVAHLSYNQAPATMKVADEQDAVLISIEAHTAPGVAPDWLLNPWQQFMGGSEQDVDLGLATAQYIIEQHEGTLTVSMAQNILSIQCRVPVQREKNSVEEFGHDAQTSARR